MKHVYVAFSGDYPEDRTVLAVLDEDVIEDHDAAIKAINAGHVAYVPLIDREALDAVKSVFSILAEHLHQEGEQS